MSVSDDKQINSLINKLTVLRIENKTLKDINEELLEAVSQSEIVLRNSGNKVMAKRLIPIIQRAGRSPKRRKQMCERTEEDILRDQKIIDGIGDELEKLRAENKALKESEHNILKALEFYAHMEDYKTRWFLSDKGEIAKYAIQKAQSHKRINKPNDM